MKLLHTADWHLGKMLEGRNRIEEQRIVLEQMVNIVDKEKPDIVCIAGDIFDNGNPSAQAQKLCYSTWKRMSRMGRTLVVCIAGNHDNPVRLEACAPLAKEQGILILGTPGLRLPSGKYGEFEVNFLGEGAFTFEKNGERSVVVCLPYPSEKRLNEVLYKEEMEEEKKADSYTEKMKALFENCNAYFKEDCANLFVSHIYTMGARGDGSERGLKLGDSYLLPASIFPDKAGYTALGHVHKPQKVPGTRGKIRYSGSILPYHRDERNMAKQCLLVEIHPGEDAKVEEIYLKNPKPIEFWECKNYEEALLKCRENKGRPCWSYLRIHTDTCLREDQLKELKSIKEDILEIIPLFEEEKKKRREFWHEEKDMRTLFEEYYEMRRGTKPDEEMRQLFEEMLEEDKEDETGEIDAERNQ